MSFLSRLVITTLPVVPKFLVERVASRYVAGSNRGEALATVKELNACGAMATVDVLGEEVTEESAAQAAVEEYLALYEEIHQQGLQANVSVKPTMLGLKISVDVLEGNILRLAESAHRHGSFLRLDMEDRSTTDATLEVYRRVHATYPCVGVVLQAYMRRTLKDIAELPEAEANVRLCKGIYIEPRRDSWKGYETVRANFVAALEKLLRRGVYVGIATHDEYLVCRAVDLLDRLAIPRDRYEFQMLLGVDQELRDILIRDGHRLRVYVPYGEDWYRYSVRRLRENPEVAQHVIKATLSRSRKQARSRHAGH